MIAMKIVCIVQYCIYPFPFNFFPTTCQPFTFMGREREKRRATC
jgi:hypothetical protein